MLSLTPLPGTPQPGTYSRSCSGRMCCSQLKNILGEEEGTYVPSSFFKEQLPAFEDWLSYGF